MSLFRVEPNMPPHMYKTYAIRSPRRPATCAEVRCDGWLHGWTTVVPADSEQAHYIRRGSGRGYTETRDGSGLAVFTFEPGQTCFAASAHGLPNEGEERFTERGGDWRGNPRGDRRELRPADWVDSFACHQDKLRTALERG